MASLVEDYYILTTRASQLQRLEGDMALPTRRVDFGQVYTWPLLLIHVHGEEQTIAHSCFVPLLCATLLEVTFSYLFML